MRVHPSGTGASVFTTTGSSGCHHRMSAATPDAGSSPCSTTSAPARTSQSEPHSSGQVPGA